MLEPYAAEIRQELAAARLAALRSSARPMTPGPLRRAIGSGFVRLGLHLGGDGSVPPIAQHESHQEAFASAKASYSMSRRWSWVDGAAGTLLASEADLAWESAAPFGLKVVRPT